VCGDADPEAEPLAVDACGFCRRDLRRTRERPPVVAEDELSTACARRVRPLLPQGVLDLEEVGEIGGRLDADVQRDALVGVVEDGQVLVEAVRDRALADHRELRVDVDRSRAWNEEEACLEVLQVVDRQRTEPLAVDRENPLGQEARVEREEPRRIGERRLDVPGLVAHDERVAVEDLHDAVAHPRLLA
jgi:hypothetical protein